MPSTQLQAGISLITFLKNTYKLNKVYPHKKLSPPSCPGKIFPLSKIIKDSTVLNYSEGSIKSSFNEQKYELTQKKLFNKEILFMGYTRLLKLTSPLMHGDDVKQVQAKLNQLGYTSGADDGWFGSITTGAVVLFQKRNGLIVDGIVGPNTWNKLFSTSAVSNYSSRIVLGSYYISKENVKAMAAVMTATTSPTTAIIAEPISFFLAPTGQVRLIAVALSASAQKRKEITNAADDNMRVLVIIDNAVVHTSYSTNVTFTAVY
jgi:hypothetical protein